MLSEFYSDFEKSLDAAKERKAELKELVVEQTDEVCEECGKPMVIRWGRRGKFLACTGFPDCRTTKSLDEEDGPQPTDYVCDECNAPMVMRTGRRGRFLSCSRYPECKTTRSIPTGVTCPECGEGELSEKSSKKGRTFYGCERYPDCKHAMWDKPVPTPCPQCDAKFVIEKTDRSGETTHRCLSCKAVMTVQPDEQAA
ncbi:MAG: topoisomerase DNA-binding C4 zinc finger domain-containing protein [Candidatus Latescibacteria bacterium]|nr:topoisomerase DNA-binding C4 zinc finger domain-containing protein [Candidatus Latescibacterota bacterium]